MPRSILLWLMGMALMCAAAETKSGLGKLAAGTGHNRIAFRPNRSNDRSHLPIKSSFFLAPNWAHGHPDIGVRAGCMPFS